MVLRGLCGGEFCRAQVGPLRQVVLGAEDSILLVQAPLTEAPEQGRD